MSAVKVWKGGAWQLVDLTGLPGDAGVPGAAGAFTPPNSTYRNYTGNWSSADGAFESGALTVANSGTNPATKVAADTRRVEVLTAGIMAATLVCVVSSPTTGNSSWLNIRRVAGDVILASGYMPANEDRASCGALFPVAVGDVLNVIFSKLTGNTTNTLFVIRTMLLL